MKVDVEGFELSAMRGMTASLGAPDCRLVMCEVHTELLARDGHRPEEVELLLRLAGFGDFTWIPRGGEWHLLARKAS